MTRLTDTQLVILNAAVDRGDWSLLPVPKSLKAKGGALKRSLTSLLDRGLAQEIEGAAPDQAWRTDEDGRPVGLAITDAGLHAVGVEREDDGDRAHNGEASDAPDAPKPESKIAQLIERLSHPDGATIADLTAEFGWLPHSARAALTGLRKRGYTIEREKREDGASVYRLVSAAEKTAA